MSRKMSKSKRKSTRRIFHARARSGLVAPVEGDGGIDVGMEAFVNGAGEGSVFETLAVVFGEGAREVNLDGEARDAADAARGHVFLDTDGGTGEIDVVALGDDAHRGHDAGA